MMHFPFQSFSECVSNFIALLATHPKLRVVEMLSDWRHGAVHAPVIERIVADLVLADSKERECEERQKRLRNHKLERAL
jgi:hypothetical protein